MRIHLGFFAICCSMLIMSACFSSPPKEEYFYNLVGPRIPSIAGKGPRILVTSFTSSAGYDSARLAYRSTSDHELQYFGFRQWVSEPSRMIMEMTIRHLRSSKRFVEVDVSDKVRNPGAVLEGNVDAIEEVNKGDEWAARLAMSFIVRKGDSETVLLRHTFDTTRPCAKPRPEEVAKEISKILAEEVKRLAQRIEHSLGTPSSSITSYTPSTSKKTTNSNRAPRKSAFDDIEPSPESKASEKSESAN